LRTESDQAIEFLGVSKRFQLHEGRTLREFLPALAKGRGWTAPFYALRDVSFAVDRGETIAIIGRNGSGKSTLLKLIAGVMAPTEGQVNVRGRVSPLIELGAGFHGDLTGRENVFMNGAILGMTQRQVRSRFDEIVAFAELHDFIDTPVKRYSSGMYMRLGFAVAAHSDPDILLVDEVLAVGDAAFQQKCFERIREFQRNGTTVVLVTHGEGLVRMFCERVIVIDSGHVLAQGAPAEMIRLYQEQIAHVEAGSAAATRV